MTTNYKIDTVDGFLDTYQHIVNLFDDESSYDSVNQTTGETQNKMLLSDIINNLVSEMNFKEDNCQNCLNNPYMDYVVSESKKLLKDLFKNSEIDESEYETKCKNIRNNLFKEPCNKYIPELNLSENIGTNTIKLTDLLSLFICKSCDVPYRLHVSCDKFSYKKTDELFCNQCGKKTDDHYYCSSFVYKKKDNKLEERCGNCGITHNLHFKNSFKFCKKFIDSDDHFGYCTDCDQHITNHFYNEKTMKLKKEIFTEVITKTLSLSLYAMRNPLYKLLVNDLNKRIYVDDYIQLLQLQNTKNYHYIL